ncbi:MAG TPA: terminase family protein [Allosphingosinicella sp.]
MNASDIEYKSLIPPPGTKLSRRRCVAILLVLMRLPPEQCRHALKIYPPSMVRALAEEWRWQAHGGQLEPDDLWRYWAIVAGRGFGKTRAGAEWVWARARADPAARIALVAATIDEVERVMVHGESGLLATARGHEAPRWIQTRGLLLFPSGAQAFAFSAERPEKLRGPQHHFAWCDEFAKWRCLEDAWNNLVMGLRLGERPRAILTTTPRPVPLLKRILALPGCAVTRGRTEENPHLPRDFIAAMREQYAGTRLARQELLGELLEDFENALWTRELLETARALVPPHAQHGEGNHPKGGGGVSAEDLADPLEGHGPYPSTSFAGSPPHLAMGRNGYTRIILGLDPPASTGGDSCGIVVCAKDSEGTAWVLADLTARGLSPEGWARRVAEAAQLYGVDRIVAEKNQGGEMIAAVLRGIDADLPVKLVAATKSKAVRAEPIALRFETGRARLGGRFPELEDQLCALTWTGYQGPGSPDRADAMVWALTELFEKEQAPPRVRAL